MEGKDIFTGFEVKGNQSCETPIGEEGSCD